MKNEINISKKTVTIVLALLLMVGTCLFTYACYAVEECRSISAYFPHQTVQQNAGESVMQTAAE